MIQFTNIITLQNLSAETVTEAWPMAPIANSCPLRSSGGRPLHAYATLAGLVIFAPERQIGIPWNQLMAMAEKIAPELKDIPQPPAPKPPGKVSEPEKS